MDQQQSIVIRENVSLKPYNTFGIKANGRYFTKIHSEQNLRALLTDFALPVSKILVIGGGSNVLLLHNFDGLVIHNQISGIQQIREDDQHVWVQVGAGENWHQFVMYCIRHNLAGIENLSLIPGDVGAAPMQNIGAYGVEIKQVFEELTAIELQTGKQIKFNYSDCQFGYRNSIFKNKYKNQFIITTVTFRLNKHPTYEISYGAIKKTLEDMQIKELSIKAISDAVIKIRRNKLPDPKQIGNAGSFFKNPEIDPVLYQRLKAKFPDIPSFATHTNKIKIPAGWLIEQCGWKGKRFGDIGVYNNQALILVNYGQGTGQAIYELAEKIQRSVYERFNIQLEPEVNIII